MAETQFLGLKLTNQEEGTTKKFLDWRLEMAGPVDSNMMLIDEGVKAVSDELAATDQEMNYSNSSVAGSTISIDVIKTIDNRRFYLSAEVEGAAILIQEADIESKGIVTHSGQLYYADGEPVLKLEAGPQEIVWRTDRFILRQGGGKGGGGLLSHTTASVILDIDTNIVGIPLVDYVYGTDLLQVFVGGIYQRETTDYNIVGMELVFANEHRSGATVDFILIKNAIIPGDVEFDGAFMMNGTLLDDKLSNLPGQIKEKVANLEIEKLDIDVFNAAAEEFGKAKIITVKNRVVLSEAASWVDIGISEFDPEKDSIRVYIGGVYQTEGYEYTVNAFLKRIEAISGQWPSGYVFDFELFKGIKDPSPDAYVDGNMLGLGSVNWDKLSAEVIGELGALADSVEAKADVVHGHEIEDVVGLGVELSSKFDQTNYGNIVAKSASFQPSLVEANSVYTVSAAATITVPTDATVAFPIGTAITIIRTGTGTVTLAPASGVTLLSKDTKRTIDGQYASATLIKTETDTWHLFGALA